MNVAAITPQVAIALLAGTAAIIDDLARRQVSNWIPALAFVGGLSAQGYQGGWSGVGSSLLGTVAGFVVFLVFYMLGGMGGGDVKLMAGFGAVLGWERLPEAALWTAGCGGLMALGAIGFGWIRNRLQKRSDADVPVKSIPYAPAIALGAWLALVPKI